MALDDLNKRPPPREIKNILLAADDDIGIQDYFHLSLGPFRVLREA